MASSYNILKNYSAFRGLDARSNDLVRDQSHASDLLNAAYTKTGAVVKRQGKQAKTASIGGAGLDQFIDIDLDTGVNTPYSVAVDDNLHVKQDKVLTITYSGSDLARVSTYYSAEDDVFYLDLFDNEILVLHTPLSVGIEDASPISINSLVSTITAVTDFSATTSGLGTASATFLDLHESLDVTSAGTDIGYVEWEKANAPSTAPLANFWAKRTETTFENASMINLNRVLYVSTGWDELHKYDGQNFYRAGMPKPAAPVTADGGAGNISNTATRHRLTYIQKDNKGNIVEGIISDPSTPLNLSSRRVNVTAPFIQASSGFNTNCAIADGAQAGVNIITVDDGLSGAHTMKVGDTAYFFDGVSSSYVERNVSAISATTITVDGAAVTVADNAVISNNLKIGIWRNQSAGTTYALVAEIPNNSFAVSIIFSDNVADASLGAEYVEPIKPHGLPPKAKYATVYRKLLILGGKIDSPNEVFYSDIDSPEFFPEGDNAFNVDTEFGDVVTGIAGNNQSLFVFKNKSISQVSGDLTEDQFRVDRVNAGNIGCLAHHTIKEVEGVLFFLSSDGIYAIASNEIAPKEVSVNIEPLFTARNNYNFKQATAVNWLENDKYVLHLPVTDSTEDSTYATDSSRTFVFDYYHGSWFVWSNLNSLGGMNVIDGKLWLTERRFSTLEDDVVFNSYVVKDSGTPQDYVDHNDVIEFSYKTHWEAIGEPSVFKKFLRLKVFSLDSSPDGINNSPFSLTVTGENNYIRSPSFELTLTFASGGDSGWGLGAWGLFPWGDSRLQEASSKLGNTRSRALRLIYTNNVKLETPYISGWDLEVATPYRVKIKD